MSAMGANATIGRGNVCQSIIGRKHIQKSPLRQGSGGHERGERSGREVLEPMLAAELFEGGRISVIGDGDMRLSRFAEVDHDFLG